MKELGLLQFANYLAGATLTGPFQCVLVGLSKRNAIKIRLWQIKTHSDTNRPMKPPRKGVIFQNQLMGAWHNSCAAATTIPKSAG